MLCVNFGLVFSDKIKKILTLGKSHSQDQTEYDENLHDAAAVPD